MIIHSILTPERTLDGVQGISKKKILEFIANRINEDIPQIDASALFESLIARERLGTTGLGNGVAIPHCRCADCPEPIGLFIRLKEPIDFDSIDRAPVDLIFALIVPEGENQEHLELLRALAEQFSSNFVMESINQAKNANMLYQSFIA